MDMVTDFASDDVQCDCEEFGVTHVSVSECDAPTRVVMRDVM